MNTLTKEFWEERAKKYGHTGFADSFLYSFDQEARKYAVHAVLAEAISERTTNALDFGCGSGDFFDVLLDYTDAITGVDISETVIEIARRKYADDKRIHLTTSLNSLTPDAQFDIALTVTVLQKLTINELEQSLEYITTHLKPGGVLVCMEFFHPSKTAANEISKDQFLTLLNKNGMAITNEYSFYNAVLYPTESWELYKNNIALRALKPFRQLKFIRNIWQAAARAIIHKNKDVVSIPNDIFKIYVVKTV